MEPDKYKKIELFLPFILLLICVKLPPTNADQAFRGSSALSNSEHAEYNELDPQSN